MLLRRARLPGAANLSAPPLRFKGTCRSVNAKGASEAPTKAQLRRFAVSSAVPFVAFGFMDNLVMIQAGDAIDSYFGVWFGLSTLTAAGFGQVFSDFSGVMFGGAIERVADKLGLKPHGMTHAQRRSRGVVQIGLASKGAGVILGCLLGMSSLLCG